MNFRLVQIFALSLLIFACSPSPEKQAQELIEKSIEAHQLSKKWEDIQSIKFKKMTRLLNERGDLESESEQWVEFRLKPYFEAKLTWTKDSILHVVNFNGSKTSYQMGGNPIQNEGFLKAKRSEIDGVFCAFAQPWNLLDENVILGYEGQKLLQDGKVVESIRIDDFSESESSWIYFDPTSFEVLGLESVEKDSKSLIENRAFDESKGILFPKVQKKYLIDEAGKRVILRAEYLYSDYEVTFE